MNISLHQVIDITVTEKQYHTNNFNNLPFCTREINITLKDGSVVNINLFSDNVSPEGLEVRQ